MQRRMARELGYYDIVLPIAGEIEASSPTLVLPDSPIQVREAVELFAKWFRREMHYDFPQFEASETPDKPWFVRYEAYLFHEDAADLWQGDGQVKQRMF